MAAPDEARGADADVVLEARDVHAGYRRKRVLRGASFRARRGEIVAILGENGAGKSTLLRVLAGARAPDRGDVVLRGTMGFCPQDAALYPYLTPDEHLRLFAEARRIPAAVARARTNALFETFGLHRDRGRVVEELSGGTKQKVNLAIALVDDPAVLLLDEPYAGFDVETYRRFVEYADRARARGTCIVVVTHIAFEPGWFDAIHHLREGALHEARGLGDASRLGRSDP